MCEYQVFNEKFGLLPECKHAGELCTLCVFGNKETYAQAKEAEEKNSILSWGRRVEGMTDRERLIGLLENSPHIDTLDGSFEAAADHLLQNGVIVPPVIVEQFVWVVYSPKSPANPNDKGKWFMLQDGVRRVILGRTGWSVETWNVGRIPAKEIGKTLFLTKEEAVKALKEREKI